MKFLVTGHAGFIGFHVAKALMDRGDNVVGFDNVNDYYGIQIKEGRLQQLDEKADEKEIEYISFRKDLSNHESVENCFREHSFDRVIHLAAQAGVRHSLVNPLAYVQSNLVGFTNLLEACRYAGTQHLTYASSSSVYGANTKMPFSESQSVDHPLQFYAATKRANELMAHSYSHLFGLPTTGLRFFTVYGPWGRPDMALFKFTKNILEDQPIDVFNYGNHTRDFTYIDDIIKGVLCASDNIASADPDWHSNNPNPESSNAPFRLFNIGNNNSIKVMEYIKAIEKALDKKAIINFLPLQSGDLPDTCADVSSLSKTFNFKPSTSVQEGVNCFVEWYQKKFQSLIK